MGQKEGKGTSEGGEGGLIKEERWVVDKEGKWVEEEREGGQYKEGKWGRRRQVEEGMGLKGGGRQWIRRESGEEVKRV